jgi:hypothetical protein
MIHSVAGYVTYKLSSGFYRMSLYSMIFDKRTMGLDILSGRGMLVFYE